MKKLSVLFLAFVLFSCGLKDTLGPDLSDDVEGVYEVYLIGNGVVNVPIPSNGNSISIELTPINKSSCSYVITLNNGGNLNTQEGIYELKKASGQIDLYQDSDKIGFIKNGELDIDYTDSNGARSVIRARK